MKSLKLINGVLQLVAVLAIVVVLIGLPIAFLPFKWYFVAGEIAWTCTILSLLIKLIQNSLQNE